MSESQEKQEPGKNRARSSIGEDINIKPSTIDDRSDRQLLDYESISCLLLLLFIDDKRLNLNHLQNIIKNLCYHKQRRQCGLQQKNIIIINK